MYEILLLLKGRFYFMSLMLNNKKIIVLIFIVMFLLVSTFSTYSSAFQQSNKKSDAPIKLTDTWKYFWGDTVNNNTSFNEFDFPGKPYNPNRDKYMWAKVTLPYKNYRGPTLLLRTPHQFLEVYIDGNLIYNYGKFDPTHPIKSPGAVWQFISLPDDFQGKVLTLKIYSPFVKFSGYIGNAYLGEEGNHVLTIIKTYIIPFILSILFIIIGLLLLFISFISFISKKEYLSILHLGSFSIVSGIWVGCESKVIQLFFNHPLLLMYISFISLFLMPVPFTYFLVNLFNIPKKRLIFYINNSAILAFLLFFVLDFLQIKSLLDTAIIYFIMLVIYMIIFILLIVTNSNKNLSETKTFLFGLVILCISGVIDMFGFFYTNNTILNIHRFLNYGLFIFLLSLIYIMMQRIINLYEKEREQKVIQTLAYKDMVTELYNRTYFEEKLAAINNNIKNYQPFSIFTFDMNGLKLVNDVFGHSEGDSLLKAAAKLIFDTFSGIGFVSRVGGDEFCAVLPKTSEEECQKAIENFIQAIDNYNNNIPALPIRIAIGNATYNENMDQDVYSVFKRADDLMYKYKLNQKANAKVGTEQLFLSALAIKDFVKSGHIERMLDLAKKMSDLLKLSQFEKERLILLVKFHDIGKLNIPENIILKNEVLTDNENNLIKSHSTYGYNIALRTNEISPIADLILSHHEHWDGKGYPNGIKENEIPLECRIFSVIEAFDVMTTGRPYRKEISTTAALVEIKSLSGRQFDPYVVGQFIYLIKNNPNMEYN